VLGWAFITVEARKKQLCCLPTHFGRIVRDDRNGRWEHLSQFKVVEADKSQLLLISA
jgi:hypothetical protein